MNTQATIERYEAKMRDLIKRADRFYGATIADDITYGKAMKQIEIAEEIKAFLAQEQVEQDGEAFYATAE